MIYHYLIHECIYTFLYLAIQPLYVKPPPLFNLPPRAISNRFISPNGKPFAHFFRLIFCNFLNYAIISRNLSTTLFPLNKTKHTWAMTIFSTFIPNDPLSITFVISISIKKYRNTTNLADQLTFGNTTMHLIIPTRELFIRHSGPIGCCLPSPLHFTRTLTTKRAQFTVSRTLSHQLPISSFLSSLHHEDLSTNSGPGQGHRSRQS